MEGDSVYTVNVKRVPGMEFVGKRSEGMIQSYNIPVLDKLGWSETNIGKRAPGMEFVGKRAPGMEFVGKRANGMEFSGKRAPVLEIIDKRAPDMEFVGKRAPGMEFVGK